MIKNTGLWRTRIFLVLTAMTLFICCQKDDAGSSQELQNSIEETHLITNTVSADDIPEIMNYLSTKGDSRGHFTINKSSGNNRSSERDLVIGTLQTREIIQITDQYDRKNYTVLLTSIERSDSTIISVFNLIIKESSAGFFSYIMEYRPDANWIPNYRDMQDFSTFTGEILHYSIDGRYIAKLSLLDGVSTSGETRNPCPENDYPDSDTGNSGGNEGDGSPGDGNTGDGSPGGEDNEPPVDVEATLVWLCNWRGQLHSSPSACDNQGAGGTWVILIVYGDKSMENTLRCPDLPDTQDVCYLENNDPCPNGCNTDGSGCAEINQDTNPVVGINYDLDLIFGINDFLEPDLTDEQVDWIFESLGNVAFAELALEVLIDGGDVDFDEKIIYDLVDKPCQKEIIETAISLSSEFTDLISNTFNANEQTNLNLSAIDIPNGNNAFTVPFVSGDQTAYYVDIKFDNTYLNTATDLSIAAVTLHELVHAYLVNLFVTNQMGSESESFNDLLNAFIAFYDQQVQDTANTLDNEIHNAMNNFIDNASMSLFNYAQAQGIDADLEYCNHLMWGTMFGTELFEEVLTEEQQANYGNIAGMEQENVTFEGESPKGSPCE